MEISEALKINDKLTTAWFIFNDLSNDAFPDFTELSLQQCIEATRIVASTRPKRTPGGAMIITTHVDETLVPQVYAKALELNMKSMIITDKNIDIRSTNEQDTIQPQ